MIGRQRNGVSYTPDCDSLNRLLRHDWNPRDIRLLGFAHSHPRFARRPSGGDLEYARRILEHNPELKRLLLPIILPAPEAGNFKLLSYAAVRDGSGVRIEKAPLELTPDEALHVGDLNRRIEHQPEATSAAPTPSAPFPTEKTLQETFQRVRGAYDLARLGAAGSLPWAPAALSRSWRNWPVAALASSCSSTRTS